MLSGQTRAYSAVAQRDGSAGTLSVYLDAGTTASSLTVGVYADQAGEPGRLLGAGQLTSVEAGTWNTVRISRVCLHAGDRYWLAVRSRGSGTTVLRSLSGGGGEPSRLSTQRRSLSLSGLPRTWTTSSRADSAPASIYLG